MRKVKEITIPPPAKGERENRDAGKTYVITEMSASKAEKWAVRAFIALSTRGLDIPEGIVQLGMAGIALVGFQAFFGARFEDIEPLMDEMMACIQIKPSENIVRGMIEDDIEEVATRLQLRQEVLELHMGFTFAEAALKLKKPAPAALNQPGSSVSQTSPT